MEVKVRTQGALSPGHRVPRSGWISTAWHNRKNTFSNVNNITTLIPENYIWRWYGSCKWQIIVSSFKSQRYKYFKKLGESKTCNILIFADFERKSDKKREDMQVSCSKCSDVHTKIRYIIIFSEYFIPPDGKLVLTIKKKDKNMYTWVKRLHFIFFVNRIK